MLELTPVGNTPNKLQPQQNTVPFLPDSPQCGLCTDESS